MRDNSRFSNLSVLVVDSNIHTLSLTKAMLQSIGATRVTRAANAISACETLQLAEHDLAIIDMEFADILSGVEIVQVVREGEDVGNKRVPIIMTSSHPDTKSVLAARDAGIYEFLRRPFSARDLHDRMVSALSERRERDRRQSDAAPDRRRAEANGHDAATGADAGTVGFARREETPELDGKGTDVPHVTDGPEPESETDPVTGIANRAAFHRAAVQMASAASRDAQPLGLLLGDIDAFREMNETHGRKLGDQVLRLVSSCFTSVLKEQGFVARCGNDEFAVLMPNVPLDDTVVVAERLRQTVKGRTITRRSTGEHFGTISMSFGAATYKAGENPNTWIARAHKCLDVAKHNGAGQVKSEAEL